MLSNNYQGAYNHVKMLLESNSDPNLKVNDDPILNRLSNSGTSGEKTRILKLLLEYKCDPNATNMFERSSLHCYSWSSIGKEKDIFCLLENNGFFILTLFFDYFFKNFLIILFF